MLRHLFLWLLDRHIQNTVADGIFKPQCDFFRLNNFFYANDNYIFAYYKELNY